MAGERIQEDVAKILNGETPHPAQALDRHNVDREAVRESDRIAQLVAQGRIGLEDLAAVGIDVEVYADEHDIPEEAWDQQVESYPENNPEIGEDREIDTYIEDGEATYEL
jgi:hypothetical protein